MQKLNARKLGVIIQPSTKGLYKIDVLTKDGEYITSIGDRRYADFLTYVEQNGLEYAEERRQLYWKRHKRDIQVEGSRGFYSAMILWN